MNILSESLDFCCKKYDSHILSYVLMPNHIHLIIHFKEGINRIGFMRDFKKYTSTHIRISIEKNGLDFKNRISSKKRKQQFQVWQHRYDELILYTPKIIEIKMAYIHNNPMQKHWNLAVEPNQYPYSSAAFYDGLENGKQILNLKHYKEFV